MMDMEQPASVMPLNAAVLVLPMDAEEAAPVESWEKWLWIISLPSKSVKFMDVCEYILSKKKNPN